MKGAAERQRRESPEPSCVSVNSIKIQRPELSDDPVPSDHSLEGGAQCQSGLSGSAGFDPSKAVTIVELIKSHKTSMKSN
ncbi:hypothetical protein Q8A67_009640 [Cirrhinus molitorella]|uniref:Uncharacterized protein n=1 Tax=Cirrhinus molitorella TaxID=172907 RepID=A0AA88PV54_9TELE|nr:hypothetical protein Q8A67_009640 [Cirrhinus molitorella]